MGDPKIITNDELHKIFEEEDAGRKEILSYVGEREIDGFLYTVYHDRRTVEDVASRTIRTVHMGFNSNDEGTEEKLAAIVEREGACKASWGVTGRTMHEMLGFKLREKLPQYEYEIGGYTCLVKKAG